PTYSVNTTLGTRYSSGAPGAVELAAGDEDQQAAEGQGQHRERAQLEQAGLGGEQGQAAEAGADQVEEDGDLRLAHAQVVEAMVQVAAVGLQGRAPAQEAEEHDVNQVEDRHAEHEQRGGDLRAADDRDHAKREAEE